MTNEERTILRKAELIKRKYFYRMMLFVLPVILLIILLINNGLEKNVRNSTTQSIIPDSTILTTDLIKVFYDGRCWTSNSVDKYNIIIYGTVGKFKFIT